MARSNDDVGYPNLMFHFLPIAVRYDGPRRRRAITVTRSTSGRCTRTHGVRSGSRVPTRASHPALRFNYLSTDQDRREWVEAIHTARRILDQPAMEPFDGARSRPARRATDEQILAWVASDAETALHPSCTCKMGTDEMSVVDPRRCASTAVDGLRVVDASVFLVRHERQHLRPGDDGGREGGGPDPGNTPLAPETVEFFRRT